MKTKPHFWNTTIINKHLKIIRDAFKSNNFHILKIQPQPGQNFGKTYFFIYLQEQILSFEGLTKVEEYLKQHSDILHIKFTGKESQLDSEFYYKSKVWIYT